MDDKIDDLKGRTKEAAGDLTDDAALKREGQADRASARVKGKTRDLADKAHGAVDAVKDKTEELVERARKGSERER